MGRLEMKVILVSSLLLAAAYGGPVHENELQHIIEIVNSSGAKWKAGQNFGEQTTIASLKRLIGMRKDNHLKLPLKAKHSIQDSDIPESFDIREQWPQCESIGHIMDQGNCGSSWAMTAAAAFSDRLCIATNGTITKSLSSEQLLACCEVCGTGCQGGLQPLSWQYFADNGLVTGGDYNSGEGCQPYEIPPCANPSNSTLPPCADLADTPMCQSNCTNPAYSVSFASDHYKVLDPYYVKGEKEIQKEIMAHGPLNVAFSVFPDFLAYKSGVYHHVTGDELGGHAMKLIGWGVEDGTPYWLLVNTWGKSWGEKGLLKIRRGTNECGIEKTIATAIPKL